MTRIQNVKVGDPMGFKVNITDELVLDDIIKALEVYHGGAYVVGKDTAFNVIPHYHIHFFSVKCVTANALKVFRNSMKNRFSYLQRCDKLYTGQDLESANASKWIAYCIKEQLISNEGIEITEEIKILSKASFETKRQNKVYSEQKQNVEKEKKEFKHKCLEYVKANIDEYEIPAQYKNQISESNKTRLLVIKFLIDNDKIGSLKKGIIDTYVMYCNIHLHGWDEFKVLGNLYLL